MEEHEGEGGAYAGKLKDDEDEEGEKCGMKRQEAGGAHAGHKVQIKEGDEKDEEEGKR